MTRRQSIRAVIFDFDGTLADTRRPIMQCFWEVLDVLNIQLPANLSVNEFYCQTLKDSLRSIDGMSEDQISDASEHYDDRYLDIAVRTAGLFPEVVTTLEVLKRSGLLIGIATNESRRNLKKLTEKLEIETLVHQCVCHDEVLQTKPFPDMALRILEAFGVAPKEALVVGDSVLDIDMGKAAGCRTCAVTYGAHSLEKLKSHAPHWVINEISDVLSIVDAESFGQQTRIAKKEVMALS
jgi:phosphoglycolate phosphatase